MADIFSWSPSSMVLITSSTDSSLFQWVEHTCWKKEVLLRMEILQIGHSRFPKSGLSGADSRVRYKLTRYTQNLPTGNLPLWRKSLDAGPISKIESGRICGIRVKLSTSPSCLMTILGVYLPCADQGIQVFRDHLIELERLVTEAQLAQLPSCCTGRFQCPFWMFRWCLWNWTQLNKQQNIKNSPNTKEMVQRCNIFPRRRRGL